MTATLWVPTYKLQVRSWARSLVVNFASLHLKYFTHLTINRRRLDSSLVLEMADIMWSGNGYY